MLRQPMKMLSGFGSINEILDFAIEKEQEASQFIPIGRRN